MGEGVQAQAEDMKSFGGESCNKNSGLLGYFGGTYIPMWVSVEVPATPGARQFGLTTFVVFRLSRARRGRQGTESPDPTCRQTQFN